MMSLTPFLVGLEIDLADCVLVKSGCTRNVHGHDNLPGLLIKTMQPGVVGSDGHIKAHRWWKKDGRMALISLSDARSTSSSSFTAGSTGGTRPTCRWRASMDW